MRKFKCESDFMRESTRIYRAYVEKERLRRFSMKFLKKEPA